MPRWTPARTNLCDLPQGVRAPEQPRPVWHRHTNTRDAAALARVLVAHRRHQDAERELEQAILDARRDNVPLRAIAKVLGKSHSSLSEWVARRQPRA